MSDVITATDLSCFYGAILGLNRVNFTIRPGITGLVGPNGAGKSTLTKLITGQLSPSAGDLTVLGQRPMNNRALLGRIGYCPEHEHIHKNVTPVTWLRSLCSISGMSWSESKRRSQIALEKVGLSKSVYGKNIGTFSKGMKQRVKLAQAIMHDPEFLILDEPMNGLDPMGRSDISEILKTLRDDGIHIVISSHILNELESLCENFLLLKWGRVVASGTRAEIAVSMNHRSDKICIRANRPNVIVEALNQKNLIKGYLLQGGDLFIWLHDAEAFYQEWPTHLNVPGVKIFEIIDQSASLENIFDKVSL